MNRALTLTAAVMFAALPLTARTAHATESVRAVEMSALPRARMDGMLREWPALKKLDQVIQGSSGKDPAAKALIGYDKEKLYVAMDVMDAKQIRTKGYGSSEDYATLILAFPKLTGGYSTHYVLLYPGEPGKTPGAVKLKHGGAVSDAQIVEMPLEGGLSFEASIPWSAFPESGTVRVGMRAALRYSDADTNGQPRNVIATSKASAGSDLPPLLLESEYSLRAALLYPKGLPEAPDRQVTGNVSGTGLAEQVAIYGRYLTIVGPEYRKGKEFYFQDLAVERASDVTSLQLVNLTGDSRKDILVRKRMSNGKKFREVLQVFKIKDGSDEPAAVFQHEVGLGTGDGQVSNEVKVSGGVITIAQGKYSGLDPNTYSEPVMDDMDAVLLPWDGVQSRSFRFEDGKFVQVQEKTGTPRVAPKKGARFGHANEPPEMRAATASGVAAGAQDGPPPPRPPTAEEKLDRVYKLYRQDQGVGAAAPRFDFVTDVADDSQPERVLVHGRDIVAFGKGFKGGESYVYITLGFKEPGDILAVTARDLTGDGKADILVRGVIEAQASKQLGGGTVKRHALFAYTITSGGIRRIFAAETGRSLGDSAILGNVVFHPAGKGVELELRPGRAIGWTQETYPFPPDRHPYAGLEPLLLPWTDMSPRHYKYTGREFSAAAE